MLWKPTLSLESHAPCPALGAVLLPFYLRLFLSHCLAPDLQPRRKLLEPRKARNVEHKPQEALPQTHKRERYSSRRPSTQWSVFLVNIRLESAQVKRKVLEQFIFLATGDYGCTSLPELPLVGWPARLDDSALASGPTYFEPILHSHFEPVQNKKVVPW